MPPFIGTSASSATPSTTPFPDLFQFIAQGEGIEGEGRDEDCEELMEDALACWWDGAGNSDA
jgi:hypothetical protein